MSINTRKLLFGLELRSRLCQDFWSIAAHPAGYHLPILLTATAVYTLYSGGSSRLRDSHAQTLRLLSTI